MSINAQPALKALHLGIGNDHLQLFMKRASDARFDRFKRKVLVRDSHQCRFCGFQSKSNLCVVNADGNYRNNKVNNMLASCPICTQTQLVDGIGFPGFGGGVLIFLPEIPQNELNAMCHVLFQSICLKDDNASQSKNIYRTFRLRSQLIEKQLGDDLSNPCTYAQMLKDADPKQAKQFNEQIYPSVRLLPDVIGYQSQVQSWLASGLDNLQGVCV